MIPTIDEIRKMQAAPATLDEAWELVRWVEIHDHVGWTLSPTTDGYQFHIYHDGEGVLGPCVGLGQTPQEAIFKTVKATVSA